MKLIKYRDNESLSNAVEGGLTQEEIGKIWKTAAFNCDEYRGAEVYIKNGVYAYIVKCQNKDEYLEERNARQRRKRAIDALDGRRDYLINKMDNLGISNSFMIQERKALDYVLEKFKEGII